MYHELRDRGNNNREVWSGLAYLHELLLMVFDKDGLRNAWFPDESSVTNILENMRDSSIIFTPPLNKRITTTLTSSYANASHYGWSAREAALFVLCVKDAATMDNKLDFWLINVRGIAGALKKMKTKDGKTITVW